jgi:hypothetical protein
MAHSRVPSCGARPVRDRWLAAVLAALFLALGITLWLKG